MLLTGLLEPFHSGKVRDTYLIPGDGNHLLMVASDRISTHNVVHKSLIPKKGEVLTALTIFWTLTALVGMPTHLVAYGRRIYDFLPSDLPYPPDLHLRAVVVKQKQVVPIELIWRAYLAGSLWRDYQMCRDHYGLKLPPKLKLMSKFPEPVFTPTLKSEHDEPIQHRDTRARHPKAVSITREAFDRISSYLRGKGVVLIDAKFEVSKDGLVDEWGTGDCARFALASEIQEGKEPAWLDKEMARQFASEMSGGKVTAPVTYTPDQIEQIIGRYMQAFELITDSSLSTFQKRYLD